MPVIIATVLLLAGAIRGRGGNRVWPGHIPVKTIADRRQGQAGRIGEGRAVSTFFCNGARHDDHSVGRGRGGFRGIQIAVVVLNGDQRYGRRGVAQCFEHVLQAVDRRHRVIGHDVGASAAGSHRLADDDASGHRLLGIDLRRLADDDDVSNRVCIERQHAVVVLQQHRRLNADRARLYATRGKIDGRLHQRLPFEDAHPEHLRVAPQQRRIEIGLLELARCQRGVQLGRGPNGVGWISASGDPGRRASRPPWSSRRRSPTGRSHRIPTGRAAHRSAVPCFRRPGTH